MTFTRTAVAGVYGCLVDIVSAAYAAEMTLVGYFCSLKYTGLQPHRMPGLFLNKKLSLEIIIHWIEVFSIFFFFVFVVGNRGLISS